jgi:signal transduction histidine kinase
MKSAPPTRETVVIADDKPESLNILNVALTRAGYDVSVFPRGELALAAMRSEPPDLALLDIRMPGLDGYELCRRLKANERLRTVPILFISALAETEEIAKAFACGGVDYITKPFREAEVLARVRTHIALRKASDQLTAQNTHLHNLERHRDTLVHMLVHDMRSPLFAIDGHLKLIESSSADKLDPGDRDSLRAALFGTRLLNRLVSEMIDVSRMETDSIPLHRTAVPVREVFRSALDWVISPLIPQPIGERIDDACPPAFCDANLTGRIVSNLLANALKYSPPGCPVVLGAKPHRAGVFIWVRDRGPGIHPQHHDRIFEKFGVIGRPPGHPSPSTGLGLTFCKLAVEAQGGEIGVVSEPGKGSTFWFTLPAGEKNSG